MQPQVVATFWMQLKDSGLLTSEQIAEFRRDPSTREMSPVAAAKLLIKRGMITRFQAERLLEGRSRGFFFDQYKITEILGVGGMGSVYQAVDTSTGDVVALKVLQEQLKKDDGMQARFLQEARLGLKLVHPHIVRTFDIGSAGGLPYMVMEFVRGPSLLELLLQRQRIPWPQACEIARQAALGLQYAHDVGLVHRDVKPQNILVDDVGVVRLLDFGLAMLREGESGDEFSMAMIFGHECVGTAEYAAPEQIDDSLAADARSDIYSLGATLFTALTGTTPFQGETTAEMLEAHRRQPLRSVRDYVPSIPQEVADVVSRMLARNSAERFASAADVAQALADWAKPGPLEFDFDTILAERRRHAREKQSRISPSRPRQSGITGSTARPNKAPSVAQRQLSSPKVSLSAPQDLGVAAESAVETTAALAAPLGLLINLITGDRLPLFQDRLVIGRSRDCQLHVEDAAVSSRHCELRFDGYHWWLADLGSRNGTCVNGVAIQQQHELQSGDEISVGSRVKLQMTYGPEAAGTASRPGRWQHSWQLALAVGLAIALAAAWWWFAS